MITTRLHTNTESLFCTPQTNIMSIISQLKKLTQNGHISKYKT